MAGCSSSAVAAVWYYKYVVVLVDDAAVPGIKYLSLSPGSPILVYGTTAITVQQ